MNKLILMFYNNYYGWYYLLNDKKLLYLIIMYVIGWNELFMCINSTNVPLIKISTLKLIFVETASDKAELVIGRMQCQMTVF